MKWYTTGLIVKDEKGEMSIRIQDYAEDEQRAIEEAIDYMISRGYSIKRVVEVKEDECE